jgi:hypothetical protein
LTVVKPIPYNNGMENVRLNYFFLWNFLLPRDRLWLVGGGVDGRRSAIRPLHTASDRSHAGVGASQKDDVLYDIGSGDGAIVIRAAKKYGVRGVGIEIDDGLVAKARANAFSGEGARFG